ncbi:hypothetical protein EYF80_039918 [Liparis tanakae]|uniref:Uncharacterized protein n=1 Tax=Liparis tanakae TaxID=230148 RepID=A0A4Z2G8K7_9TELE|nr:hypothetical protein EYF80_039918 [Liparis tanakae]
MREDEKEDNKKEKTRGEEEDERRRREEEDEGDEEENERGGGGDEHLVGSQTPSLTAAHNTDSYRTDVALAHAEHVCASDNRGPKITGSARSLREPREERRVGTWPPTRSDRGVALAGFDARLLLLLPQPRSSFVRPSANI